MIVTCVTVFVKPGNVDAFIEATLVNHNASVREQGNLRFDLLRCKTDPTRFFLYEAYETEEAAAAHKETPHYKKWKETVADWMSRPREGVAHTVIAPVGSEKWK